jgi:hypothetical protein
MIISKQRTEILESRINDVTLIKERRYIMKTKTKPSETKATEAVVKAPTAKINNIIIKDFSKFAEAKGLNQESKVSTIMLTIYADYGCNVHPKVLAEQLKEFNPKLNTTSSCIAWYKNHYDAEQGKFIVKPRDNNKKQELIAKIKEYKELEPIFYTLPALSVAKLEQIVANLK